MNPIGVHYLPTHQSKPHFDFIRDMQPGILKLVGSSMPDVQQLADGYAAAPNALMYLRNVARSEQHDFLWRSPVEAAHQHVREWDADIKERYHQARERGLTLPDIDQIRILGVNEPVLELFPRKEDMSNYDEWLAMVNSRAPLLDDYMVTFGYESNRLGYGAGLGNISSGQPPNRKPGEYATFDWFPKTRKLLESTRGKNAYTSHEYWRAESGPEGHADWHAWRFMHLDLDADIDILESGVDQYITMGIKPVYPRGWHGHEGLDAVAYVDQHRRYLVRARKDSRFRCETPFTLDGDKIWESFWIEYCMAEMVKLSNEVRASAPTPAPPINVHLPAVGTGTQPGQTYYVQARDGVNLRATPVTGDVLAAAPFAAAVQVLDHNEDATWLPVRYQGMTGWMFGQFLSVNPPDQPPTPAPSEPVPVATGIIDPIVLQAILSIESGGRTHGENGLPLIRFEAHVFQGKAGNTGHFRYDKDRPWVNQEWRRNEGDPWKPIHTGKQADEYAAFEFAKSINRDAAYNAISVGAGQILGTNHARIGYPSAEAMYNAFQSAPVQTIGFLNYFLSDPALMDAMRNKDWREIGKRYNGSGQADMYAGLLEKAYRELGQ